MKTVCPYCKKPMTGDMALPPMRPRWMRIYRAALEAGPAGISPEDLMVRMYGDNEWPTPGGPVVLRVSIHELNKRIAPLGQRIINAFRGNYRLAYLERADHEEEVQRAADH